MIVLGHVYFYRFTFIIGKMFVIDCWLHFTSACFYCIYSFIVKCTPEHESLFRNCRTPSIARCLNNSLLFARLCLMIILLTCRLDAIIQKLLYNNRGFKEKTNNWRAQFFSSRYVCPRYFFNSC